MQPADRIDLDAQAVLDGVLARSPRFLVVAVRLPSDLIQISHRESPRLADRSPLFRFPILRGVAAFFSFIFQGMDALFFSSAPEHIQMDTPRESTGSPAVVILTAVLLAFTGFILFPRMLVVTFGTSFAFGIEALARGFVFILFVGLIAVLPPFRTWFQYSRAADRVLGAFETGEGLTFSEVRGSRATGRRSSLAFILGATFLILIGFSFASPWLLDLGIFTRLLAKALLWCCLAGGAYEILTRFPWIGVETLLRTGYSPTSAQVEVALAALKQVLRLEHGQHDESRGETFVVRGADELGSVAHSRKPA